MHLPDCSRMMLNRYHRSIPATTGSTRQRSRHLLSDNEIVPTATYQKKAISMHRAQNTQSAVCYEQTGMPCQFLIELT